MKTAHYSDLQPHYFDSGDTVKNVTGRVAIGKDDGAPNFCMRVFSIGKDGFTPRHSHDWEHEIFIHSGNGQVFKEGQWENIAPGTVIFIPGNETHQIRNTGEQDLTFICLVPSGVAEI